MAIEEIQHSALESFVKCFNICYPSWCIDGSENNDLEYRHVDFDTNLRSYWGRCGPRSRGRVYFRVNSDWWADSSNGERVGLLLHELGHVRDTNHSPEFWEQVVENYRAVADHASEVEVALDGDVNWEEVDEFLVSDPSNTSVDNRRETAYERRRKIAEAIDYSGEVTPFEQMRISVLHSHREGNEQVEFDKLAYEDYSLEEVLGVFHETGTGVSLEDGVYIIQPPVVREQDEHYVVVDGGRRVELAKRAVLGRPRRSTLSVKVKDRV